MNYKQEHDCKINKNAFVSASSRQETITMRPGLSLIGHIIIYYLC